MRRVAPGPDRRAHVPRVSDPGPAPQDTVRAAEPHAANARTFKEIPAGEPPSLVRPPKGCRFHPRCPVAIEGLCDEQDPPDFNPEPDHYSACWLYK